ncbi:hypothetical protein BC827DRAFT_1156563 [Russula dissimulans]|nr:hypothetical protein BC827DRAFT_1156563 [Russula dissimulans]
MSQAPAACATDVSASALHGSADFAEALGCAILARVVERQRGSAKSNDLDGEVIPLVVFVYFRSTSAGRQRGEALQFGAGKFFGNHAVLSVGMPASGLSAVATLSSQMRVILQYPHHDSRDGLPMCFKHHRKFEEYTCFNSFFLDFSGDSSLFVTFHGKALTPDVNNPFRNGKIGDGMYDGNSGSFQKLE